MGSASYLEELDLSPEILAEGLSLAKGDVLFVTGGAAEDAGDVESELAVVLLTDEDGFAARAPRFAPDRRSRQLRRKVGVMYEHIGSADVEVEVICLSTFAALLSALDAMCPLTGEELDVGSGLLGGLPHDAAVDLLHRLRTGTPVANVQAFEALRSRVCPRKLLACRIQLALSRSGDAMAWARTSLRQNDVENAYLRLSDLYDYLGEAMLYSRGEASLPRRSRLPRLRALGSSPFVDRYLDVKFPRRPPAEPLGAFVERQLEAAYDLHEALRRAAKSALPS